MWRPQTGDSQRFRESLTYEEKIGDAISKCFDAMRENKPEQMQSAIDTLLIAIPLRLYDQPFRDELIALEKSRLEEQKKIEEKYKTALRLAVGCPDVVDKPSTVAGLLYWQKKMSAILNLCDRRGIGLKLKVVDGIVVSDEPQ